MTEDATTVPLRDVCDINPPKPKLATLGDDTEVLFVPMAAVDEHSGAITGGELRRLSDVKAKSYRTFAPGDVLFAKITPCMENGKAAVVPNIASGLGFGSTEFHVLRPKDGTVARYVWHLVRQRSFRAEAEDHMTGSVGQARVPVAFLENYTFTLPDESVQQQIATQLDELSSKSRTAERRVEAAASVLQQLHRSAIAAGAAGRLTADWRQSRGRVDGESPAEWSEFTIGEAAECLDSRRRPVNAKERSKRSGSVPYYGANGQVGWIDEALFNEPLVLVVEDETFTGRTKPFSYLIDGPSWVNNHAHVLRARASLSPVMLNLLLSFYDFVPLTSGTTGRRKLTQASLVAAPILLPPLDEQDEIVRRVQAVLDRLTSAADRLQRALMLINCGREAAVSRAFRGELVVA